MNDLQVLMAERISSGLKRKSVTTPSRYACAYRVMSKPIPGLWSFKYHPWLKEPHDSTSPFTVVQKAAQLGFTEWALNVTFFKVDVESTDVLYILPSESDASDFSAGRFNPAIEASPYLSKLFSDVSNVGHKRAGQNNIYIRGSRSRSKLKSIPTGVVIFDEVDEMIQKNIPLALERASGQKVRQFLFLSTPTIEFTGINEYFIDTTQEHFFFRCPGCSRLIELTFPECLVITAERIDDPNVYNSHLKCSHCNKKLDHELKSEYFQKSEYVPTFSDRENRGFTVNQMYSCFLHPSNLAISYLKGQKDDADLQEFYNSKLALPHTPTDAKIDDAMIQSCIRNYLKGITNKLPWVTMGVDVGKYLHVEIDEWNLPKIRTPGLDINDEATCRILFEGTVTTFEELDTLMRQYRVLACVVDRHPETREAYKFATRFWGRVLLCMYGRGLYGKQVQLGSESERTITVDRTSWLDLSLGRFKNKTIELPLDLSDEYIKHIKNPVRVPQKDADGNPIVKYINTDDDHFAHARNYSEIALPLAIGAGQVSNISSRII